MKRWRVIYHGFYECVEADTKEEAKQKAIAINSWWAGKRLTVKEDKRLYGWDLINSLGCSKYDQEELTMTVYEKLKEEFGCAIMAILGDMADNDFDPENIAADDIDAIARKVKFYLDL